MSQVFDVVVIGAGHAGCEAALAAARMGGQTLIITQSVDKIGAMSCNPAIGGTAKGHLVKEIDALGGEMAKAIDATGIQFRILNRTKGPAIWSSRAQADMGLYSRYMKHTLEKTKNLSIRQDTVDALVFDEGRVVGVRTKIFGLVVAKSVVMATGTFLNGLIHIGSQKISAGRAGDAASVGLADFIRDFGFRVARMKTGTTPRLDGKTINWDQLEAQHSDNDIIPFSFSTDEIKQKLIPCFITHTNEKTHQVIRDNLGDSPLYSGEIVGIGPRYCPSIEDKVVKFADRIGHQIFLEPHGYDTVEVYPNGLSTSLPLDAQIKFLRTIKGLEQVEVIRPGYAIEYDFVDPTELFSWLETRKVSHLFFAGQINGTTGYEEAAAQGLMAGINAYLKSQGHQPFVLKRSEAYIGVLIDDLVTKGTNEPYRMFTSRAEHRLVLREDNADLRLNAYARELGLLDDETWELFLKRQEALTSMIEYLEETSIGDFSVPEEFLDAKDNRGTKLAAILRKPRVSIFDLVAGVPRLGNEKKSVLRRAEIEIKYSGYIEREQHVIKRADKLEGIAIPTELDYGKMSGLSREIVEKLKKHRPENLGKATRISGITPAAIQILQVYIKKHHAGILGHSGDRA